ncbi:hypothetical protein T492DRAFT_846301 [Pavlovales sp. CCMP2436]|nr:hypothetical protein T492DRAFT_846301 [Pavlovales sp. CCMP2436]
MANVFGRLSSDPPMTPLEVPLVTSTSTETRLNLSGFTTAQNQNQTRDPRKTLVIRNPSSSTPANLVLPFNQSLYGSPLAFVADLPLSNELATTKHKSLGVQFSFSQAKPIAAGSIFTLGDTLKLQAETVTDPKLSTYSMNLLLPVASIHGKFSAVSDMSTAYGSFAGSFFVNRNIGTDPSKNSLGLLPTNNAFNPSWGSNMSPIPFEDVAQVAYFRGGVKKDGRNRIEAELLVTGSNAAVQRHLKYDITRFVDEQNTIIMPYDPKLKYTLFVNSANQIVFFAGASEVKRVLETGVLASIYTQIYRPVIRVCGSAIASGAYTGVISPVSLLKVLSSPERDLVLADFGQKNIQASKSKNVNFQGIYAQAANARSFQQTNVDVFTKESPTFNNNINIQTSQDWNKSDGWKLVSSSTFQNNPSFAANNAFDKRSDTHWGSSEGSNRYPGITCPTQWTISASNDTDFNTIQTFEKTNWVANQAELLTVSRVSSDGTNATYVTIPDVTFITVFPIGAHLLSAQPVSSTSFEIVMGSANGRPMSMIGSPMAWDFNIMLTKNGRIVNTGLYRFSSTGLVKTS